MLNVPYVGERTAGWLVWSALRGQTESSRALTGYKEVSVME